MQDIVGTEREREEKTEERKEEKKKPLRSIYFQRTPSLTCPILVSLRKSKMISVNHPSPS